MYIYVIIQITHIGKEVNGLRKRDGEVGEKAKTLVRKWKQLLPESENPSTSSGSSGATSSSNNAAPPTPIVNGTRESTASHSHHHSQSQSPSQAGHRKRKRGTLEEDGIRGPHVTHVPRESSSRSMDGLAGGFSDHHDFSKALMMDTTTSAASSSVKRAKEHIIIDSSSSVERGHSTEDTHRHKHKHKHKHSHKESPSKIASGGHHSKPPSLPAAVPTPKKPASSVGVAPTISSLTRPKSPPIGSFLETRPIVPGGGSSATYSPRSDADSSPAAGTVNSRKRGGRIAWSPWNSLSY